MAVGVDEGKQSSSGLEFKLHPLVLINVSDHHTRLRANLAAGSACPPVMGVMLGSQEGRTVDVSNSFEMRYALNARGAPEIDTAFLTKKQEQYKTVFPKLDVVGWYVTGAAIDDAHMGMHRQICELNEAPLLLLLDPGFNPATTKELPIRLYETELQVVDGEASLRFVRANYSIETSDAERIGVDQVAKILPGGKASGSEQLSAHLGSLHSAIKMLAAQAGMLQELMDGAAAGTAPVPHALVRQVNALVHSLPCLEGPALEGALTAETCDSLAAMYLSVLTKGVASLNKLVDKAAVAYDRGGGGGGGGKGGRGSGRGGGGSMGVF